MSQFDDTTPFASEAAERRIRMVTMLITVGAVAMLLVGLFLLFGGNTVIGGVLALVGVLDLAIAPYMAKALRRQALTREQDDTR